MLGERTLKIKAIHLSLPLKLPAKTASVFSLKDGVTFSAEAVGVVVSDGKGKWSDLIPWTHVKRCELEVGSVKSAEKAKG